MSEEDYETKKLKILERIADALEKMYLLQNPPMTKSVPAEKKPSAKKDKKEKEEEKKVPAKLETVTGIVTNLTEKGVQIESNDKSAWLPKKGIMNLDKIVLEEGAEVTLDLAGWLKKVEWK